MRRADRKKHQAIAHKRIEELFKQAEKIYLEEPDYADKYVHLARKMAMKYKVRIRPELQKRFCKHCYKYLVPGNNCRVRLQDGKLVYYCRICRKHMRFPYHKKSQQHGETKHEKNSTSKANLNLKPRQKTKDK